MFAKVVGSSPALSQIETIIIYSTTLLCESTFRVCIGNMINILKEKCEGKWFNMNLLLSTVALCGICGELAQR